MGGIFQSPNGKLGLPPKQYFVGPTLMDARILDEAYDDDFSATDHAVPPAAPPKSSFGAQFVGAIGNLAIQYNFSALGIAVAFMTSHQDTVVTKTNGLTPDFAEPAWAGNALYGTVFVGAILGQITMGRVGDLLGRRKGMCLTLALVVIGSLASALLTWGPPNTLFAILAACRFVLGFGVGGIYPMAAATAHEAGGSEVGQHAGTDGAAAHAEHTAAESRVGWAFFWQSPGAMVPYLFAIPLLAMPHAPWTTDVQFRLLLGCGSLVALVPLIAAFRAPEPSAAAVAAPAKARLGYRGINGDGSRSSRDGGVRGAFYMDDDGDVLVQAASPTGAGGVSERAHWVTLIGTGGTWFLYDVAYYSTNVFTPAILGSIFGPGDSLFAITWQSLATTAMGIPGAFFAILLLKRVSARWLSIWGFLFIAVCFALLGGAFAAFPADGERANLKFALFALATFALNFGPNVSTYVLPSSSFPQAVRGTFHGLSAASGKTGAVVGTFVYPILQAHFPIAAIMWMQVAVSLLGFAVSLAFLKPVLPPGHAEADRGSWRAWRDWVCL